MIAVFSPFRVTQPATRGKGNTESWSVTVNGAELRSIRKTEAARGKALTWKIAMWGTPKDANLLESVSARFPSLEQFARSHELAIHQGIEIRSHKDKDTIPMPELADKKRLLMKKLPHETRLYTFPPEALESIPEDKAYLRRRGGTKGVKVSRPPHVIVDQARRFAAYSDEFIVVPARQIGISSTPDNQNRLKALALYVMSDFARYYEFFAAAPIGVQQSISNLSTFKSLPIPDFSDEGLIALAQLYDQLAATDDISVNLTKGSFNESEPFYVLPGGSIEEEPPQRAIPVEQSLEHARFRMQLTALGDERDPDDVMPSGVSWAEGKRSKRTSRQETLLVKFGRDGAVQVPVSRMLKTVEQRILSNPKHPSGWRMQINLGTGEPLSEVGLKLPSTAAMASFLAAREEFSQLSGKTRRS